jgi:hypothetical protein
MFYKIFTIAITIMIAFLCLSVNSIDKTIKNYILTDTTNEIPEDIQNFIIQQDEINDIEEEKNSAIPQIWANLENQNIKKIIMNYTGDNFAITEKLSQIIEKNNNFSIFINQTNQDISQTNLNNIQNALGVMDALVIVLSMGDPETEIVNNSNYQFALQNNIPVVFLSLYPINQDNFMEDKNVIEISEKTILNLEENILNILQQ